MKVLNISAIGYILHWKIIAYCENRFFMYYRSMNTSQAIDGFSALAHATRLMVFKLLIKEGEQGLSAGVIARQLDVQPSTLTAHLHILKRAGLIQSTRQQQKILYSANIEGTRKLLRFLTQECCEGRPELCAELTASTKIC